MNIRYRVDLSDTERAQLTALLNGGKHAARKIKRAQILLAVDAGVSDEMIASSLSVGGSTVYRTKRRFVQGQPGTGTERGGPSGGSPQAVGQGGRRCSLPPPAPTPLTLYACSLARGTQALDAGSAGRGDGPT